MSNPPPNEPGQPDLLSPEWQAILRQTEREVIETLDLEQVLAYVLDISVRATQADDAAVAIIGPDGQFTIAQVVGRYYRLGSTDVPYNQGVVSRALRARQPIFTPDVTADPDYFPVVPTTCAQMSFVITWRDELIGAMVLETGRCERFTEASYTFMCSFIDRVALAIDNARAHERLRQKIRELDALTERLRAAELLKSTLLDLAAHDLRSPVHAIHDLTKILLQDEAMPDEKRRELFQAMMGSAGEALRITDELLLLRRIERGAAQSYRPIDLGGLLRAVIDRKKPGVGLRRQMLLVDVPSQPMLIQGEPALIREVFNNLIDNAIKYTGGGGHITVIVTPIEQRVQIQVIDTGYGIAPEDLGRIFDPFFRTQDSIDRGIVGTGLGLHLVRQIVEQHGGTITVQSQVDVGSVFTLSLPLLAGPSDP